MILYILKDDDPQGGYFAAQEFKPDMRVERKSICEVRMVPDFPEDVWKFALQGKLPVDPDISNDSTWIRWWPDGETIWVR